jgi:hypothetical protein
MGMPIKTCLGGIFLVKALDGIILMLDGIGD